MYITTSRRPSGIYLVVLGMDVAAGKIQLSLRMGNYPRENPLPMKLTHRAMVLNTKIISKANPYNNLSSGCRNLQWLRT
jgi:hypothetical protein